MMDFQDELVIPVECKAQSLLMVSREAAPIPQCAYLLLAPEVQDKQTSALSGMSCHWQS